MAESQSRRRLTPDEKALVECLLKQADQGSFAPINLETSEVSPMADGGMGSFRFVSATDDARHFGKRIAERKFRDIDGTPILVSLNVDREQRLFELDVWKVDFTPVRKFPHC